MRIRVIPGIKYGIYGELIPSCRSISTMVNFMQLGSDELRVCLPSEMVDEDCCQRGPDGAPLVRVTPLVPYFTMEEWESRGPKRDEIK